ncbi:MAG: ATP-dependent DNA helicase RecQ [Planctomycetota bacterium]
MVHVDDPRVRAVLHDTFGIREYRGRQQEALQGVLDGRDVLLTMPTGAGKSLAYQLPAVVLEGLTLVVSPLIALMQDQVDALRAKGVAATFVNSSISAGARRARLESCVRGDVDLLYVTPERFRSPLFLELLPRMPVTRLAVDEAHCISQWGHDFRPDYSRLGEYRALCGDPPTLALTATATPAVALDITARLRLREPLVLRTGIERPNLFLAATPVAHAEERLDLLTDRLRTIGGAGIVYGSLIRDLEALHGELARRGIRTLLYHGALSAEERRGMQAAFMASEDAVVLATNAFGMGIDKADIRFVLHTQVPRTLEAWTQEVGRAGRDGLPAWCELFYLEEDLAIQQTFVQWANPSLEYLLGVYETLRAWGERVQVKDLDDLRAELLVKERRDNRVSICLKWLEVLGVTSGSFETRDLALVRDLDPSELPEFVGTREKLEGDLRGLLQMVLFATDEHTPRRTLLARHFELEQDGEDCGPCDHTTDPAAWRAAHLAPRPIPDRPHPPPGGSAGCGTDGARAPGGADPGAYPGAGGGSRPEFARGDWVRIDGRHLGQVVRVEGRGARVRLVVESAGDLARRTVDPRRRRVERLDR